MYMYRPISKIPIRSSRKIGRSNPNSNRVCPACDRRVRVLRCVFISYSTSTAVLTVLTVTPWFCSPTGPSMQIVGLPLKFSELEITSPTFKTWLLLLQRVVLLFPKNVTSELGKYSTPLYWLPTLPPMEGPLVLPTS